MALSEAKKAADRRHNAKLDQIMIRPYKEEGAVIRAAAKASGQSVQAFVLEAIRARLAQMPQPGPASAAAPVPQEPTPSPEAFEAPREAAAAEEAAAEEAAAVIKAVPVPEEVQPAAEEAATVGAEAAVPADEALIENRFPIERLGTEVLKLPPEESAQEILRLERVRAGIDLMMIFCNMTREERDEWKRRRGEAVQARQSAKE